MHPMARAIVIGFSVLALLGTGAYIGLSDTESKYEDLPMTTLKQRDLVLRVNTIGVLDASKSHMVTSNLSNAKIIELIEDGSHVQSDAVLVRLDPTPYVEEVHRLEGEINMLEAAVSAKKQMLEWEKNQVDKEIRAAEFKVRVSELDLKQLSSGEGPLQLAQMAEAVKEQEEHYNRYRAYLSDLHELQKQNFDHQFEIVRAREKIGQLEEKLVSARSKYQNYKNHILPSLIEKARAEVEQAKTALEQTRKGSVYKIAQANAALNEITSKLENTRSALRIAREKLEKTTIRAPFAGIAILYEAFREGAKRKPRIGDNILQNQPILYLPDISAMIVKTSVREVDLHKVRVGQKCNVTVDAYPADQYEGTINFIGSLATENNAAGSGTKYFQLTVTLENSDKRLRPGMTARVNVLTEKVSDTPALPVHAVFELNGRQFCYRLSNRRFEKVEVSTGISNIHYVQIIDGLQVGDRVSMIAPPGFKDE